jgi:hypothetical protein
MRWMRAPTILLRRPGPFYFVISPLQPAWPHSQAISVESLCDSQWVLQYFWSVMQEHAG